MAGHMKSTLLAGLIALLSVQSAFAEVGSWAIRRSGGGPFSGSSGSAEVRVEFIAPSPCHYIASARQGAPAGLQVPALAVPVTSLVVRGETCANTSRIIKQVRLMFHGPSQFDVAIYVVTTE